MGSNVPRPTLLVPIIMIVFSLCATGTWSRPEIRHHGAETINPNPPAIYSPNFGPEFTGPLKNLTVPLGREAIFTCNVQQLGGYRVGWVKSDTKAIQAIHNHVITHNPRVTVTHSDLNTWNLHIHNVQEEDRGEYMCQINTDPMKSQIGRLEVVVPPDYLPEETSGDTMVPEGGNVMLTCRAIGRPHPNVTWRREDGIELLLQDHTGHKSPVPFSHGESLQLTKISRTEMGAYLCIASNGVPPSISKRILVNVHFHPVISVPNQLVGAPLGTDVTLECILEAFPKAICYWIRDNEEDEGDSDEPKYGEMVVTSSKFEVTNKAISSFSISMKVTIRNFQKKDAGSYKCIAKNSLGEVESNIRLYEIPGPTRLYTTPVDEEDYNDQFGSAEQDNNAYGTSNNVLDRFREGKKNKSKTGNSPKGTAASTHDGKSYSGSTTIYALLHMLLPIVLIFPAI